LRRCLHEAAFDPDGNKMILFGGCSSGYGPCPQGDLWSLDTVANAWTEIKPSGDTPLARSNPSLVYTGNNKFILFGGRDDDGNFANDLWELDSTTGSWTQQVQDTSDPGGRSSHDAAWDSASQQMFVFGGKGANGVMDDLWVYNPPQSTASAKYRAELPDLGTAPEVMNEVWLNTDKTLRLADLRGKVVLINFWTFGCYNCKNVLPFIKQWNDTYTDQGLVVIGVHFPEFAYEADLNNLKEAMGRLNVTWAVAQDNDGVTWRAYAQHYWPTVYLVDKQGSIRYQRIGEGAYSQTEAAIQALLRETYP
jgi:thiol-disulfide isomerase/thioredoxin